MQAEAVVGLPRIDDEMVGEVVKLGFERDMVVDSIRSRWGFMKTGHSCLGAEFVHTHPGLGARCVVACFRG